MLHRFVEFVQPLAASLGGPGLVLIAFLDSSFLSFPEVPDLLLVWLVIHHPARWPYYVVDGDGRIRRWVLRHLHRGAQRRRGHDAPAVPRRARWIARCGPFGATDCWPCLFRRCCRRRRHSRFSSSSPGSPAFRRARFGVAIVFGRGLRYLAEALLAYRYGEQAMRYINENLARCPCGRPSRSSS